LMEYFLLGRLAQFDAIIRRIVRSIIRA